ncbi:MAG: response regulator transcription factor [Actinomycetota bacterium]|nr:response regulator transcription factor [Actinomycetota bacterium]
MAEAIRVLVADDSLAFRDGMRDLLELFDDVELVGRARDTGEAVALARSLQPDVAVMDLEMPGGGGVVATREIFAASPNIGVLLLSMHDDDSSVLDAMQAGARGYLVKGARQQALLQAIRTVADGGAVFGAGIAARMIDYFTAAATATATVNRDGSAEGPFAELSTRERQVLELIARGRSNDQIAEQLSLSHGTVRNYTSAIFSKLQVSNRAAAIVKAHQAETS